ncbi:MAG TPA: membrane protein insertion efficiency factor YidD [Planctomycetota bacterium]|nr:membrane protein insertion efficiency factor YidD [Planctomycetota bacterium]
MGTLLSLLLSAWRATVGRLLPDSCRFTPSCSHYAAEALLRRGPLVGTALAAWRVLRCNPLSRGGYDPVVKSVPSCGEGPMA